MNGRIIRTLAFALPLFLLASCSKDDMETASSEPSGQNGNIRFEIGFKPESRVTTGDSPQTRVTTDDGFNSTWEAGDEIGIFAVAKGTPLSATAAANYINNAKLTYTATGTWTQATPLYWPSTASGIASLDFYAYYPYNASATDPTAIAFNVMSNQNDVTGGKSNYDLSELLTAKADNGGLGYDKNTAVVTLTFSHALAMIQLSVPAGGKGYGPSEDLVVLLRNVKTKAALDLSAIDASTAGSGITIPTTDNYYTDITMHRVEQKINKNYETYRALVPAQAIKAGNSMFWFEHEDWKYFADGVRETTLNMVAGQAEIFERKLPTIVHTVPIPAGTFYMGSPADEPGRLTNETQHQVTLTKDFHMSKYEVTNAQYAEFLNANGVGSDGSMKTDEYSWQEIIRQSSGSFDWGLHWNATDSKWVSSNANSTDYSDYPAINVSWYGANEYAKWVGGSLPTEAQWEYACRGGYEDKANETDTKPFGIGNGTTLTLDMANFLEGVRKKSTTPVGYYSGYANTYGLYDMHGNVAEWCLDTWEYKDYGTDPVTDPVNSNYSIFRVIRGGFWNNTFSQCRSAYRYFSSVLSLSPSVGFRVIFFQ